MRDSIHLCLAPAPEMPPPRVSTARDRYRQERRLRRLERRMDASRGDRMNLEWLHWAAEWSTVHDAICHGDYCPHADAPPSAPKEGGGE